MRRRALGTFLVLAALCVVGFLLRTANAATVLTGAGVVLAENDPYYHMRRVLQILAAYPAVPSFDPWIDYPNGAPVVFAPLFDLAVATVVRVAGLGPGDRLAVETLAAFVPPLLGALTCVAVWALALRTTSRAAALLAAALVTLTPAHVWYSRLGFVDHHVAVTLVAVVTAALVLRALGVRGDGDDAPASAPSTIGVALAAAALATGVLLWNGDLLLVALLDLGLLALFVAGDAARRAAVARTVCATHLGAALVLLAVVPGIVRGTGWPWSAVTLSYLHVALLAASGLVAGGVAVLVARGTSGRTLGVLALVLAGAALLAVGVQRDALARLHDWLFAADPFMGAVQESVSIVRTSDGRLDLSEVQVWMGRWFLLVPLVIGVLLLRVARGGFRDAGRLFVLVWASLLFCLTLGQRRFAETAAPALALVVADGLVLLAAAALTRLAARGTSPAAARALAAALVALLVVVGLAPYYARFRLQPDRVTAILRAPLRPGAPDAYGDLDRAQQRDAVEVRLAGTLRRLAALEAERAAAEGTPGAAMSPWPLGHKLLHVAGTPVAATPFGSYVGGSGFADSTDYFLAVDDAAASSILARRQSRWVVVDNDLGTIGAAIVGRGESPRAYYDKAVRPDGGVDYAFHAPLVRSSYFRLTRLAGSAATVPLPGGGATSVPAVPNLRLVIDAARDDALGFAKVYEVVPGAVAVVRATPGAVVEARYAYRSDAGRSREYQTSAIAGPHGEARLVLPYSSERPDLGQTSAWRIAAGDRTRELHVAERDVQGGRELGVTLE